VNVARNQGGAYLAPWDRPRKAPDAHDTKNEGIWDRQMQLSNLTRPHTHMQRI
jgi:hypothetical protein